MKTVFANHDMVAHVWNQQAQSSGRVGGENRVYFEGRKLYSYGTHYVLGFIMGDGAVLLNSTRHSISTSKHQGLARSASRNRTQYNVPDLTSIVYELDRLNDKRGDAYDLERAAKGIEAFISKHAVGIREDSAVYLLTFIGRKNPAKDFESIRAAKLSDDAKKEAAANKSQRESDIRHAKNFAEMSATEWRDYVTRMIGGTYSVSGSYNYQTGSYGPAKLSGHLPRVISDFWKLIRLGEKALGKRRVAILKARREELRTAAKEFEGRKAAEERNKRKRTAIRHVREGLAAIGENNAAKFVSSSICWAFSQALATVAEMRLPATTAVALLTLATEYKAKGDAFQTVEREQAERAAAEYKARREREQAEREAKQTAARSAWFAGDTSAHWRGSDDNGRAYVRAVYVSRDEFGNITGGELQTSQGANVPLTHAVKAFRFVKLCRESARSWARNGKTVRVGHFTVDRIDSVGNMTAGCHSFAWEEIERVARELGVFDAAASDSALETSGSH